MKHKLTKLDLSQDQFIEQDKQLNQEVKQEWTLFDDSNVVSMGNWEKVMQYCIEFRCYPTVLFFEKLDQPYNTTHQQILTGI